jgi:uncharacterized damage-inducible protein DinB
MKNQYAMFAGYNAWANKELYGAAAALPAEEFGRDIGLFFHSMRGTLNHLLVADRIWMRRFTRDGPSPTRLDEILFDEFSELAVARKAEDRRIIRYIDSLKPEDLLTTIVYTTIVNPTEMRQGLAAALSHFFNHQTHHRGQAHSALSILGRKPPSLDLLLFQRSEDGKAFA